MAKSDERNPTTMIRNSIRSAAAAALGAMLTSASVACTPSDGTEPDAASVPPPSSSVEPPAVSADVLGFGGWPTLTAVDWSAPDQPVGDFTPEQVASLGGHVADWVRVAVADPQMWHVDDVGEAIELSATGLSPAMSASYIEWEIANDPETPGVGGANVADDVEVFADQSRIALGWKLDEGPIKREDGLYGLKISLSARVAYLVSHDGGQPQWLLVHETRTIGASTPEDILDGAYEWQRGGQTWLYDVCEYADTKRPSPAAYPSIAGEPAEDTTQHRAAYADVVDLFASEPADRYVSTETMDRLGAEAARAAVERAPCDLPGGKLGGG